MNHFLFGFINNNNKNKYGILKLSILFQHFLLKCQFIYFIFGYLKLMLKGLGDL